MCLSTNRRRVADDRSVQQSCDHLQTRIDETHLCHAVLYTMYYSCEAFPGNETHNAKNKTSACVAVGPGLRSHHRAPPRRDNVEIPDDEGNLATDPHDGASGCRAAALHWRDSGVTAGRCSLVVSSGRRSVRLSQPVRDLWWVCIWWNP